MKTHKFEVFVSLPADDSGKVDSIKLIEALSATVRHHLRVRSIHDGAQVVIHEAAPKTRVTVL